MIQVEYIFLFLQRHLDCMMLVFTGLFGVLHLQITHNTLSLNDDVCQTLYRCRVLVLQTTVITGRLVTNNWNLDSLLEFCTSNDLWLNITGSKK